MIDITFLLLIFFVVCSTMDPTKIGKIPEAENGLAISAKNSAVIFINPGAVTTSFCPGWTAPSSARTKTLRHRRSSNTSRRNSKSRSGASKQHVMLFGDGEVKVGQVTRIQKIIGDAFEDLIRPTSRSRSCRSWLNDSNRASVAMST